MEALKPWAGWTQGMSTKPRGQQDAAASVLCWGPEPWEIQPLGACAPESQGGLQRTRGWDSSGHAVPWAGAENCHWEAEDWVPGSGAIAEQSWADSATSHAGTAEPSVMLTLALGELSGLSQQQRLCKQEPR